MSYSIIRHKRITISKVVAVILISILIFTQTGIKNDTIAFLLDNTGLMLIAIGVFGRIWASMYISGNKKNQLVTQGPYDRVRNPLYLFSFLAVVGVVLSSRNIILMILTPLLFMVYYPFVVMGEEKRMMALHGERFVEYMNKTPRFLPRLNGRTTNLETKIYKVNVDTFFKVFFDAIWFFIAYVIVDVIKMLHSNNLIPLIFKF